VALKRFRQRTGKWPQFELSETSNIFDLYVPLDLGFEALSRLIYYEADHYVINQRTIDNYCPVVAQCLLGAEWRLKPDVVACMAPIVTKLLLRQTKWQMRLVAEMTANCRRDLIS
jgi:hypothetical protein